jgi:tRNA A37 threonylcarbamoyladenosine modification protein TsaB
VESLERVDVSEAKASSLLLPSLEKLLSSRGLKPEDVTDFVVHIGPGSGTGLRMGLSMVQAWVMVHGHLRVHGVPLEELGLEVLKQWRPNHGKAQLLCDAFGGELFRQSYEQKAEGWIRCGEIELIERQIALSDAESCAVIPDLGPLRDRLEWPKTWTWYDGLFPDASQVLAAAQDDDFLSDVKTLDVRYLKATSAEINWEKRKLENGGAKEMPSKGVCSNGTTH